MVNRYIGAPFFLVYLVLSIVIVIGLVPSDLSCMLSQHAMYGHALCTHVYTPSRAGANERRLQATVLTRTST